MTTTTATTTMLLAHGGPLVLLDLILKVAVLVGWVLAFGVGALIVCGVAGVVLRGLLKLRWTLIVILPLIGFSAAVVTVRAVADEKSLVPEHVLMSLGVPAATLVGLAIGLLVALPPRMTTAAAAGSASLDHGELLRPRDAGPESRTTTTLIREGMTAPLAGWQVMQRYPALWRYAIIPVVLNVMITLLILFALVTLAVWFGVRLHPTFAATWSGRLLEAGTILLLVILALGGALAAWVLLNGILCGYYYGKLAREVEIRLGMSPDEMKEITFGHQVVDTFRDLAAVLGINCGVLALNIVPGLGTVIAFPLGAYFNALLLGRDFLDFPLGLRGLRRDDKNAIIRQHRWETVGLGTAAFLFQLIPILGAIVSATAVVGAVVLNRRWSATPASAPVT